MAYKKFEGEEVYFDYSKTENNKIMSKIIVAVVRAIAFVLYRIKYIGRENIPSDGGFIIACNHVSVCDPVFLKFACRPTHFMAKGELFTKRWFSAILRTVDAFPVKRGNSDKTSVEYAIRLIKEGKVLGMFPEGTCSDTGLPGQPKAGVALVAKATHADILPVAICTKNKGRVFQKVVIRFGEIIPYENLGLSEDKRSSSELRTASRMIMDKIVDLWKLGPNSLDKSEGGESFEN